MKALNNMENLFGGVSGEVKRRIIKYINDPNFENWDDISSLIVNDSFKTVWECILSIDPTFPNVGRSYDENDNIIREWAKIPLPLEVVRAIKENTK